MAALRLEPNEITYSRLATNWPKGPRIQVTLHGADTPIFLPLRFLEHSGDNTWSFAQRAIGALVNEEGLLQESDGLELDLLAPARAGNFAFVPKAVTHFTWKRGPQGARANRPVREGESDDRSSISASSSTQLTFREDVTARDGKCLLSHRRAALCQAAHLVPKARYDIYQEVLQDQVVDVYKGTAGVLLDPALQKAYDRFEWSFYCKDGMYIVHVFKDPELIKTYHGRVISPQRFNIAFDDDERPDTALCNWHYTQCLLMHLRGFSSQME